MMSPRRHATLLAIVAHTVPALPSHHTRTHAVAASAFSIFAVIDFSLPLLII